MSQSINLVAMGMEQIDWLKRNPQSVADLVHDRIAGRGPSDLLNLEDAWDVLFFLLTNSAFKGELGPGRLDLGLILVGEEWPDADCMFCTCLYPEDVSFAARALSAFTHDDFRRRYASDTFTELDEDSLYRVDCWREEDSLEELLAYVDALKVFFVEAAAREDAVLSYGI